MDSRESNNDRESFEEGCGRCRIFWAFGVSYLLAIASLYLTSAGSQRVAAIMVASTLAFFVYLGAMYVMSRVRPRPNDWLWVIVVAFVARVLLIPATPTSSDDIYRYLWEGLVQLHGYNPFSITPIDPLLEPLREQYPIAFSRMNHQYSATIYGPVAQGAFALAGTVAPQSVIAWKVLLLSFEALVVMVMLLWGRTDSVVTKVCGTISCEVSLREEEPVLSADEATIQTENSGHFTFMLLAYLWCPLLVFETYEAGHLDLLGVGFLVIAWCLQGRLWWASALALGCSIGVKYYWPVLVLPLLLKHLHSPYRKFAYVLISIALPVALFVPYRGGLGGLQVVATRYLSRWRTGSPFAVIEYIWPGPWWALVGLVMVCCFLLACYVASRSRTPRWREVQLALGMGILFSPAVFPWYLVWLVPGLAYRRGLTWIACVGLAVVWHEAKYTELSTGEWSHNSYIVMPVMLVMLGLLACELWSWMRETSRRVS